MRVTPQDGPPKSGGPRQVPRSPPLKHTTAYWLCHYSETYVTQQWRSYYDNFSFIVT